MKAIELQETEGKTNCETVPGKSGEYGCLQYLPSTWSDYSNRVLGYVARQSRVNQQYVAVHMIEGWIAEGYSDREIALIWNGGSTVVKRGVNKYGEKYDTELYAQAVLSKLQL